LFYQQFLNSKLNLRWIDGGLNKEDVTTDKDGLYSIADICKSKVVQAGLNKFVTSYQQECVRTGNTHLNLDLFNLDNKNADQFDNFLQILAAVAASDNVGFILEA